MLSQHSGTDNPIGLWNSLEEDFKGLRVSGKLAIKTKRGSDIYEQLKMKPRSAMGGLSIGFCARNYTLHKSGPIKRTLTDCGLETRLPRSRRWAA